MPNTISVAYLSIGELKTAASIYISGMFTWAYITAKTAWEVRAALKNRRPDIYH
jgi:hypothetical protein